MAFAAKNHRVRIRRRRVKLRKRLAVKKKAKPTASTPTAGLLSALAQPVSRGALAQAILEFSQS